MGSMEKIAMVSMEKGAPASVMVVDDDDLFRESLTRNLTDAGFEVHDFSCGPSALEYLTAGGGADVAIFDWRMPSMTGIELLKQVRKTGCDLPVVFLTALTDQIYEEAALATGAVDFVEKARSFAIMLRRLHLILEGAKSHGPASPVDDESGGTRAGHLLLRGNRAWWKGKVVELTLTEFKMVAHMVDNAGGEVTYRALYDVVHGEGFIAGIGEDGFRANVRTFIKRIRQKFRSADEGFDEIENYAGFGYRWKRPT